MAPEKENTPKRGLGLLHKSLWFLLFVICAFVIFRYYQKNHESPEKSAAKHDLKKIEKQIVELENEDKILSFDENKFANLTVQKLQSGGAEFIYQLMVYNQAQIADLKVELRDLRENLEKYRAREKLQKMTLQYVKLRQKIFDGIDYKKTLQSFELLAADDDFLTQKIAELKENLDDFVNFKNLEKEFNRQIPALIAAKKFDSGGNFMEKIRFNLAKIVTIRKIDEDADDVDGRIERIAINLREKNCQKAYNELEKMDEKMRKNLHDFQAKLFALCKVEEVDEEVINHLESLI